MVKLPFKASFGFKNTFCFKNKCWFLDVLHIAPPLKIMLYRNGYVNSVQLLTVMSMIRGSVTLIISGPDQMSKSAKEKHYLREE